jgi:hypothetical protein
MSFFEKMKDEFADKLATALVLAIVGGVSYLIVPAAESVWAVLATNIDPHRALGIATLLLLASITLAVLLYLSKRSLKNALLEDKLRAAFGVLWDGELEPYCPTHQTPLSGYGKHWEGSDTWAFRCVACNAYISLSDDNGKSLSLPQARTELKAKWDRK